MVKNLSAFFLTLLLIFNCSAAHATAALTSVGVQYGSVAIGSGATSNTSTITAVGAGGFIIWMGQSASASVTDPSLGLARVQLTNSTTVTANRGASDTNTVTVNYCVIDGDTTNLIKSVQKGTISLSTAQTSNTATISAVTNNNAAVVFLGVTSSTTGNQDQYVSVKLALSGTTVTASRNSSGGVSAVIVSFEVIEFQGAALNSAVQNISQSNSSGTSNNTTITGVTAANTWIAWGGHSNNTNATAINAFQPYVKLTNGTTATVVTNADPGGGTNITNYAIVEFKSAMLTANAVQRGTVSLAGASSGTLTITGVTKSQAMTNWLNNTTSLSALNFETIAYLDAFTNTTTNTVSNTASVTGVGSVEVIEFNPAAAAAASTDAIWYGQTF